MPRITASIVCSFSPQPMCLALASQYTLTLTAADTWTVQTEFRQFIWKDENKNIHSQGPTFLCIGIILDILKSTASPPSIPSYVQQVGESLYHLHSQSQIPDRGLCQVRSGIDRLHTGQVRSRRDRDLRRPSIICTAKIMNPPGLVYGVATIACISPTRPVVLFPQ